MARFGRIQNGTVQEIIVADVLPEFHPTIAAQFIVIPNSVQVGWTTTDGQTFLAPAIITPSPSPLDLVTAAVKSLPVEKRTDPSWGIFIGQCLLAIDNTDMESLAYMVNNALTPPPGFTGFHTADTDYTNILNQAKQLFGLGG